MLRLENQRKKARKNYEPSRKVVQVSFKLPLFKKLEKVCKDRGLNPSVFLRSLFESFLDKNLVALSSPISLSEKQEENLSELLLSLRQIESRLQDLSFAIEGKQEVRGFFGKSKLQIDSAKALLEDLENHIKVYLNK